MDSQFQALIELAVSIQKSKNNVDNAIKKITQEANEIQTEVTVTPASIKKAQQEQKKMQEQISKQAQQQLQQSEKIQAQIAQTIKKRTAETAKLELAQAKAINKEIENNYKLRIKNEENLKKQQLQNEINLQKQAQQNVVLDLDKENFLAKIDAWVKNNGKALPDFGIKIDEVKAKIKSADAVQLQNLNKQFRTVTKEAEAVGKTGDTFVTKLKKNLQGFGLFMGSATIIMTALNSIRTMTKNVVELDESLTELKKVTDLSGASLDNFTDKAFELGRQIGRTGKEVIDAVTIFKRAGYTLQESMDLSKASLVMTNVGDGINNVADASSALISVLKGFNFDDSQAMNIVSMINETSNTATIDFQNITEGLRRVSGTLSQTGTSIEQTIGLITGGFGQLRDVEMVSSGLVMISQRLRGIDEDGQAIDGLAPKLQKDFKEIADIDIQDSNGNLRSTYDILSDMARVFPTLTSKQKQFLGEEAAGNVALHVAKVA